jgi:hypothetical protein
VTLFGLFICFRCQRAKCALVIDAEDAAAPMSPEPIAPRSDVPVPAPVPAAVRAVGIVAQSTDNKANISVKAPKQHAKKRVTPASTGAKQLAPKKVKLATAAAVPTSGSGTTDDESEADSADEETEEADRDNPESDSMEEDEEQSISDEHIELLSQLEKLGACATPGTQHFAAASAWVKLTPIVSQLLRCDSPGVVRSKAHLLLRSTVDALLKRTPDILSDEALHSITKIVSWVHGPNASASIEAMDWIPSKHSIHMCLGLLKKALLLMATGRWIFFGKLLCEIYSAILGPMDNDDDATTGSNVHIVAMGDYDGVHAIALSLSHLSMSKVDRTRLIYHVLGGRLAYLTLEQGRAFYIGTLLLCKVLRGMSKMSPSLRPACVEVLLRAALMLGRPGLDCFQDRHHHGVQFAGIIHYIREKLSDAELILPIIMAVADAYARSPSWQKSVDVDISQESEPIPPHPRLWRVLTCELVKMSDDTWATAAKDAKWRQTFLASIERITQLYKGNQEAGNHPLLPKLRQIFATLE